ncbi:MAG: DUF4314 domain-containing protein [Paludibacteraceae bacterium]|nr:DUF4314 domain-containing protein [Paludibacteraceae bacterium]
MKVGDKIRVIRMDDSNGKDTTVHRMNGVVGVISHIDDMGQIHLDGYGLAVIPEVDEFEVIER